MSQSSAAYSSIRELLDSLAKEQNRNQQLLASLGFALRHFTNLNRFLDLVPVIASRLVCLEGVLLVPFHLHGVIWKEQIRITSPDKSQSLIRKLQGFSRGQISGFAFEEDHLLAMDSLVQAHMPGSGIYATSLVSRGRHYGRLYAFDRKGTLVASDVNRRHIQIIADLTAVAIENDLFIQETRKHESVDRQLSIGAEIQAQLLPDHCPIIEGIELAARCRPAFQVGGDYYDFMPTRPELLGRRRERGRWALVVGDVMGKGIPAGLLMTMLRGMLRAEVLSGLPPDRILHDLNQLALDDLAQSHRFVTLFYSDYDPRSHKLRFANAAHNPPLLWKADKQSVSRLDAPGLLIGLQPDADYVCGEITLDPGDVLLYYTDGVTEALGMNGDRFDETRLIALLEEVSTQSLSAQAILEKLFKRLDRFVGNENQLEDDASMVVLKVGEGLLLPKVNNSLN
ncbi:MULTISPECIES: PP2C family protein-serine/threonine phosphatase [Prochlorococcus]|uniref:PP2C family protein-serine/threonine phosphatase n=1 Tax=Prochlorococcus sp. MIT 0601 TaxID=1499498 RepID=UPI001F4CE825|nr:MULTISPECIES: PP2C family protein-serine/threonine phosphatase [Prochlorococcus]